MVNNVDGLKILPAGYSMGGATSKLGAIASTESPVFMRVRRASATAAVDDFEPGIEKVKRKLSPGVASYSIGLIYSCLSARGIVSSVRVGRK